LKSKDIGCFCIWLMQDFSWQIKATLQNLNNNTKAIRVIWYPLLFMITLILQSK
jgi:hypothetical protein